MISHAMTNTGEEYVGVKIASVANNVDTILHTVLLDVANNFCSYDLRLLNPPDKTSVYEIIYVPTS